MPCSSLLCRSKSNHAKLTFFDMAHSNNAARIRLWIDIKRPEGMGQFIESQMLSYTDLKTPSFEAINPMMKVPALIRTDGTTVFESNVILGYLEDKFEDYGPRLTPLTPEGRQSMELLCRVHDLYLASANTTAAGFSHSQGGMYLSHRWHGAARGMDLPTRAAKLGEIWRQLSWLEGEAAAAAPAGPHLLGAQLTLADLTWFPTCAPARAISLINGFISLAQLSLIFHISFTMVHYVRHHFNHPEAVG